MSSQKGYNYPIPDNPLTYPPRQKTIAKQTETEEAGIKIYPVPEQPTLEQKIEESDVQKSDDYLEQPESSLLYTSVASDRDEEAKEDAEENTQTLPPYVRNTAATTTLKGIYTFHFSIQVHFRI